MERYGFHIIISIQASDALIMKNWTEGRAVDRSIVFNYYLACLHINYIIIL